MEVIRQGRSSAAPAQPDITPFLECAPALSPCLITAMQLMSTMAFRHARAVRTDTISMQEFVCKSPTLLQTAVKLLLAEVTSLAQHAQLATTQLTKFVF